MRQLFVVLFMAFGLGGVSEASVYLLFDNGDCFSQAVGYDQDAGQDDTIECPTTVCSPPTQTCELRQLTWDSKVYKFCSCLTIGGLTGPDDLPCTPILRVVVGGDDIVSCNDPDCGESLSCNPDPQSGGGFKCKCN